MHRPDPDRQLSWPFGSLECVDDDDIRMTAYEIFFTSCRPIPWFRRGGHGHGGVGMTVTSKIKRALGLKMLKHSNSSHNNTTTTSSTPSIGFSTMPSGGGRSRRPLTSAEIMRQQMKVTEASDNRLRKTLMRTLVGQMGRRAETIILPLELIRHLKPSEFNDANEYHAWQKRQLNILEAGLILHPSIPLDKSDTFAMHLRDIIRSSDLKPIDIGKSSETMRTLCNCVVSLAWRSADGSPADTCHWADGFPFNVNLYVALLQSIFDLKDESCLLDEVDELLELMKKTWTTLGLTNPYMTYVSLGCFFNNML
ncbi:hypothetical protein OSB04_010391 [Centaurea solstitialis]|uniref:Uncharacterized protein n=1 Tax=Centaurea solstitialis TaxID=347529 RepID=A0AA38TQJ9_9ASTR|nr:hypothetical protein OSB04_010391 [Centaurea solstitialis]